ncbi:MAG: glycosyltransferase family 39 protein [Candidatus Methanofastidiosia archaeon]|jgi:hypothetical protein
MNHHKWDRHVSAFQKYWSILILLILFLFSLYLYFHKYPWLPNPDDRTYVAWGLNIYDFGKYIGCAGSPITSVPPLHCHLIAVSYALFGPSLDSAQAVSIFFAALCSPLAFIMGKTFYNEKVGILCGIFTATSFLIWRYSSRTLSEPELIFFVNLSILLLYLTVKKGTKKYPFFLGISMGLGYLTKELIVFIAPLLLLILIEKNFDVRTRVRNFFICISISGATVFPWFYYLHALQKGAAGISATLSGMRGSGALTAWGFRTGEEIFSILTLDQAISLSMLILFYIGIILTVRRYFEYNNLSDKLLVLSVGVWFSLFLFNVYMPFRVRRLIPMVIPLYLLASRSLTGLYERIKKVPVAIEVTKPLTFVTIIFLLSYGNTMINSGGIKNFNVMSLRQENEIDQNIEVLFRDDCNTFLSHYNKDEVVGSLFAWLFYFYTHGEYECYRLKMQNLSEIESEKIIYQYSYSRRGISEEGFLRQLYEDGITVVAVPVLYYDPELKTFLEFLQVNSDIFTDKTESGYKTTTVFEVDRGELETYIESLD